MSGWQMIGWIGWLGVLAWGFPREFWPKFRREKAYQHWVLASVVGIFVLWQLEAGLSDGLQVHFLAMTVLVLCHGWRIACWVGLGPMALMMAMGLLPVADAGIYGVLTVLLPALSSFMVFQLTYRYLPHHLFIYLFVAAFFNGALTMVVHQLATGGAMWLMGGYSWAYIVDNYLLLLPLLLFPEALLNGMAITLLVVYKPEWVRSFHDNDYLMK
ncbi:hypothetical protein L4C36_10870 [Photobacterium japonica]|uniref:hypothetical protein n=1 Tax=Photobacterium japonica TaxID=2910235 RepID=UPI003D11E0E8